MGYLDYLDNLLTNSNPAQTEAGRAEKLHFQISLSSGRLISINATWPDFSTAISLNGPMGFPSRVITRRRLGALPDLAGA
jgi:hypothetical protein